MKTGTWCHPQASPVAEGAHTQPAGLTVESTAHAREHLACLTECTPDIAAAAEAAQSCGGVNTQGLRGCWTASRGLQATVPSSAQDRCRWAEMGSGKCSPQPEMQGSSSECTALAEPGGPKTVAFEIGSSLSRLPGGTGRFWLPSQAALGEGKGVVQGTL